MSDFKNYDQRKIEALERIAMALEKLTAAIDGNHSLRVDVADGDIHINGVVKTKEIREV